MLVFLGILGVILRQKLSLHFERGRMKTFWTNLPLTIRAAVIFCYAYAAVRLLNLFAEVGTAPLTPRTLLDGALTVAVVLGALVLYLGNALGAALRARREGYEPRPVGIIVAYALFVAVCALPCLPPHRLHRGGGAHLALPARPRPGSDRRGHGCSWRD